MENEKTELTPEQLRDQQDTQERLTGPNSSPWINNEHAAPTVPAETAPPVIVSAEEHQAAQDLKDDLQNGDGLSAQHDKAA